MGHKTCIGSQWGKEPAEEVSGEPNLQRKPVGNYTNRAVQKKLASRSRVLLDYFTVVITQLPFSVAHTRHQ